MGGDTVEGAGRHVRHTVVSIAGGDSWVGIQGTLDGVRVPPLVSIAGGDSWVGIRPKPGG